MISFKKIALTVSFALTTICGATSRQDFMAEINGDVEAILNDNAAIGTLLDSKVSVLLRTYVIARVFMAPEIRAQAGDFFKDGDASLNDDELDYRISFLESKRLGLRHILGRPRKLLEQHLQEAGFLVELTAEGAPAWPVAWRIAPASVELWKNLAQQQLTALSEAEGPQQQLGIHGLAELNNAIN